MANKTIQQLDPLTTADASDLLALYDVSANGTNKITTANLLNTTTISGLETTAKTIPAAINELNNDSIHKGILPTSITNITDLPDGIYTFAAAETANLSNWPDSVPTSNGRKLYISTSNNNYRYYELRDFDGDFYLGHSAPSEDTVSWNTSIGYGIGSVTSATGTYTTAQWTNGTNTCIWTAPAIGTYIAIGTFMLADTATENRNIYKQLQFTGTAQKLAPQVNFYDSTTPNTETSNVITRQIINFIKATNVGQTLTPYVHTGTTGVVFNCTITVMRIQ